MAVKSQWRWILACVYTVFLTYLLLSPERKSSSDLGEGGRFFFTDSSLFNGACHLGTYAILAGLLVWASQTTSRVTAGLWSLAAVGHGLAAEGLQHFVPSRYSDWGDVLLNSLGAGIGWALIIVLWRVRTTPASAFLMECPE